MNEAKLSKRRIGHGQQTLNFEKFPEALLVFRKIATILHSCKAIRGNRGSQGSEIVRDMDRTRTANPKNL